jgi:AcrR family transcriptional regulator
MVQQPDTEVAPGVRERIITAAVQLLHERGINELTQASVSALAGVRQSHLTYYFPTRNDLLQQAVISGVASVLHALEGAPGQPTNSPEQLLQVLEEQLGDRRMPRMMAALVVASEEDPVLKPWLDQFQADMRDHMQRVLNARGLYPSPRAVEMFQATLVGALQLDLGVSTDVSRERTRAIVRDAFAELVAAGRCALATTNGK